jgi:hypothetical protein
MAKQQELAEEYVGLAERELDLAIEVLNTTGEILDLTPEGRMELAKAYALVSIARSLQKLAGSRL